MGKTTNWPYVINMGNSIIGVTVLAMPFCFRTCGVFLGILLLTISSVLTYMSCSLLVRAASHSRRHTYEYLAFHTFGRTGKFVVEVSIIGLLIGTCVAFYVIIGDLGPSIISRAFSVENTPFLRTILMVLLGLFVALPLGLLRDLESLSSISAVSLTFYCVFVIEVIIAAIPNLMSGVWISKVVFWNPDGIFKCLPIFSLAFSCQTQLFLMYQNLPDPSLKRMSSITKSAITLCCTIYLSVGYFGYVAFCDEDISGDVLMNFRPTFFSELIKFGFVISIATSFPLVIFPCRSAINTLFYPQDHDHSHAGPIMIPENRFKFITTSIVIGTLLVGIKVPNIEFVLALTGATMGSVISFIFPAVMFISVMNMTHSKTSAQFVLFLGISILIASTYVTLYTGGDGGENGVASGVGGQRIAGNLLDIDALKLGVEPERDKKESVIRVPAKDIVIPPQKNEANAESKKLPDIDKLTTTTPIVAEPKKVHIDREDKERQEPANPIPPDANPADQKPGPAAPDVVVAPAVDSKQEVDEVKVDQKSADTGVTKVVAKDPTGDVLVKEEAKQLLKEIKENHQQQKKMIEQQKEILDQMKLHQLELHKESMLEDNKADKETNNQEDAAAAKVDKLDTEVKQQEDNVIKVDKPKKKRDENAIKAKKERKPEEENMVKVEGDKDSVVKRSLNNRTADVVQKNADKKTSKENAVDVSKERREVVKKKRKKVKGRDAKDTLLDNKPRMNNVVDNESKWETEGNNDTKVRPRKKKAVVDSGAAAQIDDNQIPGGGKELPPVDNPAAAAAVPPPPAAPAADTVNVDKNDSKAVAKKGPPDSEKHRPSAGNKTATSVERGGGGGQRVKSVGGIDKPLVRGAGVEGHLPIDSKELKTGEAEASMKQSKDGDHNVIANNGEGDEHQNDEI